MATQQVVPVTCPNCQAQFAAPLQSIVDGQDPFLKSALLQGRLNVIECPQCGFTGALNTPMLYYDQEKELAFVLAPNQLSLTGPSQEKVIGNLTNSLINSLPAEERKFYLLNPKQFLTLDGLVKAILEADGITEEMLKAQEAKVKLIQEFLQVADKASLKEKIKAHEAELDREFFEILTASIQAAQMAGETTNFQAMLGLRGMLAQNAPKSRKIVAEIDAELEAVFIESQEELLEKLQSTKNEAEFEQLIAAGAPMLDYAFFQKLTGQIDEAAKAKNSQRANELTALRSKILDVKAQQDAEIQAAFEKSSKLLQDVIKSSQPDQVLAKNLGQLDQAFFMVLSANIEEARRRKQTEVAQVLTALGNIAMGMLQERELQRAKHTAQPESKIEIATR
jgi:hypothetical protein